MGPAREATADGRIASVGRSATGAAGGSTASGAASGRSSDVTALGLAGSLASLLTAQQRCGRIGGRPLSGHCRMQQESARSSAIAARGDATAMRAVGATATIMIHVVSRFRDTYRHCMSGPGE